MGFPKRSQGLNGDVPVSTVYTWKCNGKYMPVLIVTKVDWVLIYSRYTSMSNQCVFFPSPTEIARSTPQNGVIQKTPFQTNDFLL